ncbi:MAG: hypothetical protein JWQ17_3694 [Tardiphaga sp.]|jgi:hypothetical protein|nr:hypothetical protein [Tardiphaga sp.]
MTTPEKALIRRRLQILKDHTKADAEATEALKQDNDWVTNFIANLDGFIRKIR